DRDSKQAGQEEQFRAANDGVGHTAAAFTHRSRKLGEKVPVDRPPAVKDQVTQNKKENRDGNERAHAGHRKHESADQLSPSETSVHARPVRLPREAVSSISSRAKPFSMKVSRKSTRPS